MASNSLKSRQYEQAVLGRFSGEGKTGAGGVPIHAMEPDEWGTQNGFCEWAARR